MDPTTSESLLDQPTHRALAKEVALQGITMLRNEGGVLPLRRFAPAVAVAGDTTVAERQRSSHSEKRGTVPKSTQKRTVAVLGPLGDRCGHDRKIIGLIPNNLRDRSERVKF